MGSNKLFLFDELFSFYKLILCVNLTGVSNAQMADRIESRC